MHFPLLRYTLLFDLILILISMLTRFKQKVFGFLGKEEPKEAEIGPRVNPRLSGYIQFKVNGEIIHFIEVNYTRLFFKAFNEQETVQTLQDQYKWCHGKEMELDSDTVKISPNMPLCEILTSTASRQIFEDIMTKIDKKQEIKVEDIPQENKEKFQKIVKKCNEFHSYDCNILMNNGPGKPLKTGLQATQSVTFNKIIEMMNEHPQIIGRDIEFENENGEKVDSFIYDTPFKELQMKQNFFNARYSSRNSLIRGNSLVSVVEAEEDSLPIYRLESLEKVRLRSYNPDKNRIVLSKMKNFKKDLVIKYYRIVLCPIIQTSMSQTKNTILEATGDFRICVLSQFQLIWLPVSRLNEDHLVQGIDNLENAATYKIVKIEVITLQEPEYFYGLESLPEHQFIANSIIVHNSESYTIQVHYIYHQRKEVKNVRFYRHQRLSKYFDGKICEVGGYRLNNNHTFGDYQLDQIQIMYVYEKDKVIPPRRERTISEWKKESVDKQSLDEKQKQQLTNKLDEEYFGIYDQRIIPYSQIKEIQQRQEEKIINILVAYRLYFQRINYYLNNQPRYCHLEDQAYNQNLKYQKSKEFESILKNNKLNLTKKELTGIYVYTRPEIFSELNKYLRGGYIHMSDELANRRHLPYAGWISKSVGKAKRFRGKVFRGMNNIDLNKALGLDNKKKFIDLTKSKKEKKMQESLVERAEEQAKIIIFTAFTSCSKKQSVATGFANNSSSNKQSVQTVLTIYAQNGYEVEDYSQFPEEKQILILPFTYFVLNSSNTNGKIQTAELEEIPMPKTNLDKIIFWVDDQPQNNEKIIKEEFERRGIQVVQITSTRIMQIILSNFVAFFKLLGRKVVIISDMVRVEQGGVTNYTAGVDLFLHIYSIHGLSNKAIIYTKDEQRARANLKEKGVIDGNWAVFVNHQDLIHEVFRQFQNM